MKVRRKPTIIFLFISSIFMMFTLAWLTISLPFVYVAQQTVELNKYSNSDIPANDNDKEDETDNPLAGATEEKTSKNINSMSEEYLHDNHSSEQYLATVSKEYKLRQATTYIAFYGELISPPPDVC